MPPAKPPLPGTLKQEWTCEPHPMTRLEEVSEPATSLRIRRQSLAEIGKRLCSHHGEIPRRSLDTRQGDGTGRRRKSTSPFCRAGLGRSAAYAVGPYHADHYLSSLRFIRRREPGRRRTRSRR